MPANPKATLEELLQHLGFPSTVEEHHLDDGLLLDVKADDSGRLIGRQGQTLSDLQYLLNRLLFQQDQSAPKVMGTSAVTARKPAKHWSKRPRKRPKKSGVGAMWWSLKRSVPLIGASFTMRSRTIRTLKRTASKWREPTRRRSYCGPNIERCRRESAGAISA